MHVSDRYRYQSRCDTSAGNLYDIRIGAGGAGYALDLVRYFQFFRCFHQKVEYMGIDVGSSRDNRSAAKFNNTDKLRVHTRLVSGKCHIGGDADNGIDTMRACFCTPEAKFLLDG